MDSFYSTENLKPYLLGLVKLLDEKQNGRNVHEVCNLKSALLLNVRLISPKEAPTKVQKERISLLISRAKKMIHQSL